MRPTFGGTANDGIHAALTRRLADLEAQKPVALSSDADA